jgi:hypothetical protein
MFLVQKYHIFFIFKIPLRCFQILFLIIFYNFERNYLNKLFSLEIKGFPYIFFHFQIKIIFMFIILLKQFIVFNHNYSYIQEKSLSVDLV